MLITTHQSTRSNISDDYICPVFLLVAFWKALPLGSVDDMKLNQQMPCDIVGLGQTFPTAVGKLQKDTPATSCHRHVFSIRCVQFTVIVHEDDSSVS